jgi:ubiquitin C-terminal hydrolase
MNPEQKVKLSTFVNFPIDNLEMSVSGDSTKYSYSLYALINHKGTLEKGHYISYCRNEDDWYRYDDSHVKKVLDPAEIISDQAYMLFYRRS